ncbi:MAG TPA: nucleoside deaminase [Candidatus Krumholzibacteria bacterium]|nr:nucleoside deaminase [Candidatus Krumholzibacteria bacterium]
MNDFMNEAVAEAARGIAAGEGGPFGAVIVKDGRVVARAHNQVVGHGDPTAHAEVQAIRAACRALGTFDLAGCEIFSTCEPCPMCFSAIHWARLDRVHFGASRADAAAVGFDDDAIYQVLAGSAEPAFAVVRGVDADACRAVMQRWHDDESRVPY